MSDLDIRLAPAVQRQARLWYLWRQMPLSFRIGSIILAIHFIVAATGPTGTGRGQVQVATQVRAPASTTV